MAATWVTNTGSRIVMHRRCHYISKKGIALKSLVDEALLLTCCTKPGYRRTVASRAIFGGETSSFQNDCRHHYHPKLGQRQEDLLSMRNVTSSSSYSSSALDSNIGGQQAQQRPRRRKKQLFEKYKVEGMVPPFEKKPSMSSNSKGSYSELLRRTGSINSGLEEPYSYDEEYFKLANLSPWVPVPDPVARKMFDISAARPEDIHVDLGSGDGRVNFHAIDCGVCRSYGIDVDKGIVEKAKERLQKRHPQPDITFVTTDLLDETNDELWDKETGIIPNASILTMFFVTDALQQLRPILERKLIGKKCKIITCGYEMKGWNPTIIETILGMTLYLYDWGSHEEQQQQQSQQQQQQNIIGQDDDYYEEDDDHSDDVEFFLDDDILIEKPKAAADGSSCSKSSSSSLMDKYSNKDKQVEHIDSILPGYDREDRIDGQWDDFDDDEDSQDNSANEANGKNQGGNDDCNGKNKDDEEDVMSLIEKHRFKKS